MTPKKRRSSKAALKEEKLPEVAVDLVDEQGAEAVEKAEESGETEKTEAQAQRKNQESKGEKIKQNINSIKEKEGIIGYILRNSKSASIDLKDPSKVIDYAILSSSAFETSEELSSILDLGQVNHSLIEGSDVKILSIPNEENKVTVFMEKKVDHKRIYKDLSG